MRALISLLHRSKHVESALAAAHHQHRLVAEGVWHPVRVAVQLPPRPHLHVVDAWPPRLRVMAVGHDHGVEHLLRGRPLLSAVRIDVYRSHLPFHVGAGGASLPRRHGDAHDPGVEPDGAGEPERGAEVLEVAEHLAVAPEAARVAAGSGHELEVGEAHALARGHHPHRRVHAAVHLHRRGGSQRVAGVGPRVVQPLPADIAALLHNRDGEALAPQLARRHQPGQAGTDDADLFGLGCHGDGSRQ
ncbi:hypothetical protein PVAP13_2NG086246 [Panicum virgatum]|uniref:Uncharacterized protein n=1 Tax=Panicum virgatum TaxID=38727 RepID=A0A8T0VKR5_PANVG|nr:hypothetical protein PVAP13_2NG086246 [Panicum virgatum]